MTPETRTSPPLPSSLAAHTQAWWDEFAATGSPVIPLASSGWASATRLALGDPRMGAGILATNSADVAAGVRAMRTALDAWLAELEAPEGPNADALQRRLAAARAILESSADDAG